MYHGWTGGAGGRPTAFVARRHLWRLSFSSSLACAAQPLEHLAHQQEVLQFVSQQQARKARVRECQHAIETRAAPHQAIEAATMIDQKATPVIQAQLLNMCILFI